LRRSSSSASDNIAESYHKTTIKEKIRFLSISKGEAEETKRGILKSVRKKFLSEEVAQVIADKYTVLLKGTNAYIKFLNLNELEKMNKQITKTSNQ
jgi:four helix bundle protein